MPEGKGVIGAEGRQGDKWGQTLLWEVRTQCSMQLCCTLENCKVLLTVTPNNFFFKKQATLPSDKTCFILVFP